MINGRPSSLVKARVDAGNSVVISSAVASPTSPFVGEWSATREEEVRRILVVVTSTVASGLGGTFVIEFSENGVTANISKSSVIQDFSAARDFDLLNAGAFFRVKFTPSRVLAPGELVVINCLHRSAFDGAFVKPATQQTEESNVALPQTFAYLRAFDAGTNRSVNVRTNAAGGLHIAVPKTVTYAAAFRAPVSPFTLTLALTSGLVLQPVVLWHPASAAKTRTLRFMEFSVASSTGSAAVMFDLVRVTSAPTGGTTITSAKTVSTDSNAGVTLTALPAVNSLEGGILASHAVDLSATQRTTRVVLQDTRGLTNLNGPTMVRGVAEGIALVCRAAGTVTLNGVVSVLFTEE